VVTVAGIVPFDAQGVAFTEGMAKENVEEFGAAAAGREAIEAWMVEHGQPMLGADAHDVAEAFGDLVDDTDRAVLADGWAAGIAAEYHRVAEGGTAGWADDDIAFVSPWGFDPADVSVLVTLLHAGRDRMPPVSHSRWMAQRITHADYQEVVDRGNLALLRNHREPIVESVGGYVA
jgi:pimeloyl-ACP methyl ester carboxylesterase